MAVSAADGTYPTGMHSCFFNFQNVLFLKENHNPHKDLVHIAFIFIETSYNGFNGCIEKTGFDFCSEDVRKGAETIWNQFNEPPCQTWGQLLLCSCKYQIIIRINNIRYRNLLIWHILLDVLVVIILPCQP